MKLGNNIKTILVFLVFFFPSVLFSEEKITSTPLVNLNKIKPSFEETNEKNDKIVVKKNLKKKEKKVLGTNSSHAILIGLDKITAKSERITVNLNEVRKFGPLEIKILKCGKVKENNSENDVAYMQVKDLSKSENEKVFIFNGWTFASDPSLTPFDHAIYDLQLINCNKI